MGLLPFFRCNLKQLRECHTWISVHADGSDLITMGSRLENGCQWLFLTPLFHTLSLAFLNLVKQISRSVVHINCGVEGGREEENNFIICLVTSELNSYSELLH